MQEKEGKTDREQIMDMIGDMGVRVRLRQEEVVDVVVVVRLSVHVHFNMGLSPRDS